MLTCGPDSIAMEADEPAQTIPRKRERSVSPTPSVSLSLSFVPTGAPAPVAPFPLENDRGTRIPKRLRRNRDGEVDVHVRAAMGGARRAQKKDRKKARKAARGVPRAGADDGGMEVDEGLEGTFMTL